MSLTDEPQLLQEGLCFVQAPRLTQLQHIPVPISVDGKHTGSKRKKER